MSLIFWVPAKKSKMVEGKKCLPFVGGSSFAEELKDVVMCVLGGGTRTCPKAALLFLGSPFLASASSPFPDEQLFKSALWDSGKAMEAGVCSLKTINQGQKSFHVQEPHRVLLSFKCHIISYSCPALKVCLNTLWRGNDSYSIRND